MRIHMRSTQSAEDVRPTQARTRAEYLVAGNSLAPAFPLVELLATEAPREVSLALFPRAALEIELS